MNLVCRWCHIEFENVEPGVAIVDGKAHDFQARSNHRGGIKIQREKFSYPRRPHKRKVEIEMNTQERFDEILTDLAKADKDVSGVLTQLNSPSAAKHLEHAVTSLLTTIRKHATCPVIHRRPNVEYRGEQLDGLS